MESSQVRTTNMDSSQVSCFSIDHICVCVCVCLSCCGLVSAPGPGLSSGPGGPDAGGEGLPGGPPGAGHTDLREQGVYSVAPRCIMGSLTFCPL